MKSIHHLHHIIDDNISYKHTFIWFLFFENIWGFQIFNNPQFCEIFIFGIIIIFFNMIITTIRSIDYSEVAWFLDFHQFNWCSYNLSQASFIITKIKIKVNLNEFNQILFLINIIIDLQIFIEDIAIISEFICITYVWFLFALSFIFKRVFHNIWPSTFTCLWTS